MSLANAKFSYLNVILLVGLTSLITINLSTLITYTFRSTDKIETEYRQDIDRTHTAYRYGTDIICFSLIPGTNFTLHTTP
jgi:hypothetical protein